MTWPALLLWLLILISMAAPIQMIIYLFFISQVFGGLSLLPPGALGNVPVPTLCAAVLIAKTFFGRRRVHIFLEYALDLNKLGLLALLGVYAAATAFLYPRLFAGQVQLFSLNAAGSLSLLAPSSANVTQTVYILISIGMAFVFAHAGQSAMFRQHFLYAYLACAVALLGSGLIDMALGDIGHEDLLAPLHNATYHLLDSVSIAGQKRVVGFFPEASAFGAICCAKLAFLTFNRRAYKGWLRDWGVPVTAIGLLYMVYVSTSSGAYVGAGILIALVLGQFGFGVLTGSTLTSLQIKQIFGGILGLAAAALVATLLSRAYLHHVQVLFDDVLFNKTASSSYVERSSWTKVGAAAFVTTKGIGVGVGSVRTSNWIVNFAASTGVVGLILFGLFVLKVVLPPRDYPDVASRRLANGVKLAVLPGLVMTILSGTTPDPGPDLMLSLGLIYALRQPRRRSVTAQLDVRSSGIETAGGAAI